MQWLLENKIVNEHSIDTFEDTAKDVLICNMKHWSTKAQSPHVNDQETLSVYEICNCEKRTNLHYIMYQMFTNLKYYKNTLRLLFTKMKMTFYKNKHTTQHKSNLNLILYSPPGQIEVNKMCSFPGGLSYHSTMEHFLTSNNSAH